MKLATLNDGEPVFLKTLARDDLERCLTFFANAPGEDRRYLRVDVTQAEVVSRLIAEVERGQAHRVLALVNDEIVGHGALRFAVDDFHRHVGEIRIVTAEEMRGRGVSSVLVAYLFAIARQQDLLKVVIRLAGPQRQLREVCEQLGFGIDAVLEDHVIDSEGNTHPLVLMSCSLDAASEALREYYTADDWPDG